MMVDVVTNQAAEEQNAEAVQAEDKVAAEEMAQEAQEQAVQDNAAQVDEPSSEQKEWDDILEDEDETPEELKAEEKPEEEETKPEETPVEESAEEASQVPEVPEKVEAAEVEVPVTPEVEDTRTPEEVQTEITKVRDAARENLVNQYKWTDEQVEQFEEDPGTALSNMAADLFLDLFDSISQGLRGQMPGMVQGIMNQQEGVKQAEQQFYGAWPQLSKPEYRETVNRIADTYRTQFPSTDNETAVKEIGAQAWVALRLPLEDLMAHTQGVPEVTTAPTPRRTHVPASAGNAPQSARTPVQQAGNEYEELASELLLDDG